MRASLRDTPYTGSVREKSKIGRLKTVISFFQTASAAKVGCVALRRRTRSLPHNGKRQSET
ncbi:hypothetical protein [Kingella potus]|uniref:hypothetical protein n=1 Tax=Kingella potus TaxID=265175 RepID=UPI001FD0634D|nr:hypothetical protein [Kingella potus]UOP01348.1 hypothetical protein LVJ84_03635 [Kingella potus]